MGLSYTERDESKHVRWYRQHSGGAGGGQTQTGVGAGDALGVTCRVITDCYSIETWTLAPVIVRMLTEWSPVIQSLRLEPARPTDPSRLTTEVTDAVRMTLSQPQRQFVGVATAVDPPTAVDESTAALAAACEHPDANPWAFLFVSQSLLYRGTSNIEESGPHSVAAKWANLPSERVTRADVNEQEITEYEASQLPQLMIMDESESDDTTLSGFIQYSDITKVLYNLGAEPADGQPSGISTVPYGSRVTNRIIDHAT